MEENWALAGVMSSVVTSSPATRLTGAERVRGGGSGTGRKAMPGPFTSGTCFASSGGRGGSSRLSSTGIRSGSRMVASRVSSSGPRSWEAVVKVPVTAVAAAVSGLAR